jgi:hypothetical protein
MNERIRELAECAGGQYPNGIYPKAMLFYPSQLQHFAELIVTECLDIVDENVSGMVGVNAMQKIEDHFGMRID